MDKIKTAYKKGGQAEILRASQKDEVFIDQLRTNFVEVIKRVLGIRGWLRIHSWVDECCEFLYFAITTLSSRQTLGEEYTGLLQINDQLKLPTVFAKIVMVVLQCFGLKIIQRLLSKFERSLHSGYFSTYFDPQLRDSMQCLLPTLKHVPNLILRVHLASFYFKSSFYHLSKRITGIKYVLLRNWYGDGSGRRMFRILGIVLYSNIILYTLYSALNFFHRMKMPENESSLQESYVTPSLQCSLCLGERKAPCVSPCGHVFCWNCLHRSLQSVCECPLCRFAVQPEQVIPLLNYH